jgi:HprK-related kinase B
MSNLQRLLDAAESRCTGSLLFDFGGYHLRFYSNSTALITALRSYYRYFLATVDSAEDAVVVGLQMPVPEIDGDWQTIVPAAGKPHPKEALLTLATGTLVRKLNSDLHTFISADIGTERRVCFGDLQANLNQLINIINNVHLDALLSSSGQLLHAAGVCKGQFGLALAGKSGQGKSTLALRLLQRGMNLVSNDRLVVQRQAEQQVMHGIAKYPRINPGTIVHQPELRGMLAPADMARYEAMSFADLWLLEDKYDALIEPAFGVEFVLHSSLQMFIALDWDHTSTESCRLEPCLPQDCPQLVETVMKAPDIGLPRAHARIPAAVLATYTDVLSQCPCFVLSGGVDFDRAADLVLDYVSSISKT